MWTELPKTGKGKELFTSGVLINECCSRQKEGQASQQGQIHLQDVPEGRLSHPGPQEPPGSCWTILIAQPVVLECLIMRES
jgi:hypothetical protein